MSHIDAPAIATTEDLRGCAEPVQPTSSGLTDVIGEISFDTPATLAAVAAIERCHEWCFAAYRVQLVRLFLARNRERAVLLFRAPDAESVRLACRHAAMPFDRVWACGEIREPSGYPSDERSPDS